MQRSQSAVPSKLSPWICVGRALYPHRAQWHGGVVRTVLPECQQTGVQSACALRRDAHTHREREMQAATTPLTLIASNRGSPWDRAECSLGKNPPVQLLPSVWYLFIPASVGVLLLWSFQSSQDLCWERAAPLRPVRRTADWHTQDHECLLGLTVHQLVSVIKRNQMEKCTMIGRSFIPEGYANLT